MANLFYRILTAAILLPLVIYAFFAGGITLALLLSLIALFCSIEISLIICADNTRAIFYAVIIWAGLFLPMVFCSHFLHSLFFLVPMFLMLNSYVLFSKSFDQSRFAELATIFYVATYIYLGVASIFWLQNAESFLKPRIGLSFILLACIATWANDSFSYFGGRMFGKHPLFKTVSAKKTWEGFISGAVFSLALILVANALTRYYGFDLFLGLSLVDIFFIVIPSMVLGPLGDLVESRIKRLYNIKDSSNILPGHGGVFDRIDALLLVMPWTALYAFLIRPLC